MENSADRPLPTYFVCPSCGVITQASSGAVPEPLTPAPCCGAVGDVRVPWPPPVVAALLEYAGTQTRYPEPTALLLAVLVQILLESSILHIMKLKLPSDRTGSLLLDGKRDISSLIVVYDTLSDAPLESVLGTAFVENILLLSKLRDVIVADLFHAVTDDEAASVDFTRAHLLKAFMLLHNDIVSRFKAAEITPQHRKSILIVDDELNVLDRMARIVERQGITALKAPSGADALRLFSEHRPDRVFLDVSLPDMDGLTILGKMKEIDPSAAIYFITGIGGEAFAKEAERLGAAGYLPKPVDLDALLKLVRSV